MPCRPCRGCTSSGSGSTCQARRCKKRCWDVPPYREFVHLDSHGRLPDESAILRFRHRWLKREGWCICGPCRLAGVAPPF
ncbi:MULTISPECIES: transposase [Delftia]|uniref:Transposase n=2 Tax=Delftia TaxID=80865 RepID=A0A7T2S845_DELAC|nr:transposase [Delftia acidovorans]